jgi:hypothetical protein
VRVPKIMKMHAGLDLSPALRRIGRVPCQKQCTACGLVFCGRFRRPEGVR